MEKTISIYLFSQTFSPLLFESCHLYYYFFTLQFLKRKDLTSYAILPIFGH